MKKVALMFCLFVVSLFSAFTMGGKNNKEFPVENPEGFQEYVDIDDYSKGKYNFYIEATDKGGNETIAGPYNIYIDPESDLPIVGFINPQEDMRIPGNLNIVGTCVDDDDVAYVELMFNRDPETIVRAEGAAFWSYYMDTSKLEDGLYTITAWGIDINGLKGREKTISWNLDRKKPKTDIESHSLGQLVSGKTSLKGFCYDGNQIASLSISVDDGKNYTPVKIQAKKKDLRASFSAAIDTTKFEDGPKVIWFKAIDKMGTVGYWSYLLYVDNTKPEVKIVFPEPKEEVNGIFTVAGYAQDVVGLESLSWQLGKESGEFELAVGNPWWTKTFDIRGQKTTSLELVIKAVDVSGNVSIDKYKIPVNQNADLPIVSLSKPALKEIYFGDTIAIDGYASDDDGISSIFVSLDGNEAEEFSSTGSFQFQLKGISPGLHTVSVWAKDITGIIGPKVVVKDVVVAGDVPRIQIENLLVGVKAKDATMPFIPGIEIHPEAVNTLQIAIESGSELQELHWDFGADNSGSLAIKAKTKGKTELEIPIPQNIDFGAVPFTLSATDIYGRVGNFNSLLYVRDLSVARGNTGVVFNDPRAEVDTGIVLEKETPFYAYLLAGKLSEASLSQETNVVRLIKDANSVRLEPGSEYGSARVAITMKSDRGFTYSSKTLHFINPAPAPNLSLEKSHIYVDSVTANKDIIIAGNLRSFLPLDSFRYKIYAAGENEAIVENRISDLNQDNGSFSITVPKDLPYGPLALEVQATLANKTALASCTIYREDPYVDIDFDDPKLKIPSPTVQWVQGKNLYYFVQYLGKLDDFSLKVDGSEYEGSNQVRCGFIATEDLGFSTHTMDLTLKEETGKTPKLYKFSTKYTRLPEKALISLSHINDNEWRAGTELVVPFSSKSKQEHILKALVKSDEPVLSASWTIGSGTRLKAGIQKRDDGYTELSLILPQQIEADRLAVEVTAEFKNMQAIRTAGEIVIVRPLEERARNNKEDFLWVEHTTLKDGTILLEKNKALYGFYVGKEIKEVSLLQESASLSARVKDGLVQLEGLRDSFVENLSFKITDIEGWSYTTKAYRFLIDSKDPYLKVLSPVDGLWVQDSVDLEVEADDDNGIQSLSYSLDLGNTWIHMPEQEYSVNLRNIPDGSIGMAIRAVDRAGRETIQSFSINKDTKAPEADFIVPVAGSRINGENTVGIRVLDEGKILSIHYISPEGDRIPLEPSHFLTLTIGTEEMPLENEMAFEFIDASGNVTVLSRYPFIIDKEMDLPVVEVSLPEENEVIITDFDISGIVYDDDKPARIYYQIDEGPEIAVDCENGYSVFIPLSTMTDNEHKVVVTAEDIYGLRGKSVTRNFRISLEEPKASVVSPRFDETVSGVVEIKGIASDENGIDKVYVSLDSGNSFNEAEGTNEWSYRFDTKILKDGTNVIFVKVFDSYGIEAFYSSLINIDNTAPVVFLESPQDGSSTVGPVFVSGRATDSISLESLTMTVRSLEGEEIPERFQNISFGCESIITYDLDLSDLTDGLYNIDIVAIDAAQNKTNVSRNIHLIKEDKRNFVECLYPLDGEFVQGSFNLYGYLGGIDKASTVTLLLNGIAIETSEVQATGYFKFSIDEKTIPEGKHVLQVMSDFNGKDRVTSEKRTINYKPYGPWITVDSLTMGDYAFERPWLSGRAGYVLSSEDEMLLSDKTVSREIKNEIRAKKIKTVDLSFDNGKTFSELKLGKEWKYRLETQDMTEGMHYLVLRAFMENGEVALTRMLVQIDNTAPSIILISPEMGKHYNQELEFTALINDDIELKDAQYVLRKGDKASYEVPGFIQGLYLDGHFWGGTLWDIGIGLTFFDDNVKLQVQYGQFTQAQWESFTDEPMRYGGNVFGAKLLANIYYLPFSYLFGPDFSWLSANFALGANYSYFTETQSGSPQMMSAVLAQLEFPRITMPKWKSFRTTAFYTELQLWFVPTDVDTEVVDVATFIPHITCGLRVNLF